MAFCTVVCIIPIPRKRPTCSKLGRYGLFHGEETSACESRVQFVRLCHLSQSDSSNAKASNQLQDNENRF